MTRSAVNTFSTHVGLFYTGMVTHASKLRRLKPCCGMVPHGGFHILVADQCTKGSIVLSETLSQYW
ncbi:MAG: hypothetical protein ACKPKO_27210, partial [Candidatus Fonsibacter sp.]